MPLKNKQTEKQQQQKKNPINLEFHQNRKIANKQKSGITSEQKQANKQKRICSFS